MIHFRDAGEVLNILRDMVTYMSIQNKNDELGERIFNRAMNVLNDNDNTNVGDINEEIKQTGKKDSNEWYEEIKYTLDEEMLEEFVKQIKGE